MTFDFLSTVALTASAAIVIATLAIGFGATTSARINLAAALSAWFLLVVAFAATEIFHYERGILGVQGLGAAVALPVIIVCLSVLRSKSLRRTLDEIPLSWLIGVNAVRVIGVDFVILYALHRLPAPFAPLAGWGDILVGVTALPVAYLVAHQPNKARPIALLWNIIGIGDLVMAVGLGVVSSPGPTQLIFGNTNSAIMATLPWLLIPGFLVPILITTHLAIFYRLRSSRSASAARPEENSTHGYRVL
jgi:hypothetical protein